MKMLQAFRGLVHQAGTIKRAWFTSFNLSPAFLEGYILPVLAGVETRPRSAADFELIQSKLDQENMDIRFFCDGRMAELNEGKKTAVPIHLVRPGAFGPDFAEGVFHPKVVLLQNSNDETFLMTGSANLTVGGWAHNRECLFSDRISGQKNAEALEEFFRSLFRAVSEVFPDDFAILTGQEQDPWIFSASGAADVPAFPDTFLIGDEQSLLVWSPYFADPLDDLIDTHLRPRLHGNAAVSIIPDLSDAKLRIKTMPRGDVSLYSFDYPDASPVEDMLDHAKVWCTEKQCAVGSWNMTAAALGVAGKGGNNIEAGVILPFRKQVLGKLFERCRPIHDVECMEANELAQDKPDLGSYQMPYDMRVSFDWVYRTYNVALHTEPLPKGLTVRLPDIGDMPLTGKDLQIPNPSPRHILTDRFFYLLKDGKRLQCGVIIEINTPQRPAWRYTSLNELLASYMEGNPGTEKHRVSYFHLLGEIAEEGEYASPLDEGFRFSYFSMFRAFDTLRARLDAAREGFEHNAKEYIGWLCSYPGSLVEAARMIAEKLESDAETDTRVFTWFLVQEANSLLDQSVTFLRKKDKTAWETIIRLLSDTRLPVPELGGDKKASRYTKYIMKECGFLPRGGKGRNRGGRA